MSNGTPTSAPAPTVLGIPLDANHVLLALGGAAAAAYLLPAGVVIGGLVLGATEIAALGGYAAAKSVGNK